MANYGGVPQIDFSILGDLGNVYKKAQKERTLADLGRSIQDGNVSLEDAARMYIGAGDTESGLSLAKLADARAQQDWNRTYQGGMLDVARQTANKPQIVGTAETGFYALGPDGRPQGANPGGGAPPAAPVRPPVQPGTPAATVADRFPQQGQPARPGVSPGIQPLIPPVNKADSIPEQVAQRRRVIMEEGQNPNDPSNRAFILTGRMPREDQQPLTVTDKKAILEADEAILTNSSAIEALGTARKLNSGGTLHQGIGASQRATLGNNLYDWMVPDSVASPRSSEDTKNYENVVLGQALGQLKAIFGGAPTEGERKVLLDLQASVGLPQKVRDEILNRATRLAENRMKFNQQRANELRGGTFYKPSGGQGGPAPASSQPTTRAETMAPSAAPPPEKILSDAKQAISAGAPREAVIKFIRDSGLQVPPGL